MNIIRKLRTRFSLYDWADEEIRTLVAYWTILRSQLHFTAKQAWDELVEEIEQTNYDKFLELNGVTNLD